MTRRALLSFVGLSEGWRTRLALAGIACAYLFWALAVLQGIQQAPVFCDEPGWINAGFYYGDLVLHGDFSPRHWEGAELETFGDLNPHLGKLMLGIPLAVHAKLFNGGKRFAGMWNYNQDLDWNLANGRVPPPEILRAARVIALAIGAVVAAIPIALAWLFWGRTVSVSAAFLLLLLTPLFKRNCGLAMTDQPYILFLCLGMVCGAGLLAAGTPGRRFACACALGLSAGLAASVKVTGVVVLGGYTVILLGLLWLAQKPSVRSLGLCLAAFSCVAFAAIYALNPVYWPRFTGFNAAALGHELHRAVIEREPVKFSADKDEGLWRALSNTYLQREEIRAAYPQLSALVLPPLEFFLQFPRWSRLFQKIAIEGGGLGATAKPGTLTIVQQIVAPRFLQPFFALFLLLGLYVQGRNLWQGVRRGAVSPQAAVMILFLVQLLFLVFTMPVSFQRYYLGTMILGRVLIGVGLVFAIETAWRWRRGSSRQPC